MRGTEFSDERYDGLERVPAALTALGSRGTWGKVVVKVPQEGEEKSKLQHAKNAPCPSSSRQPGGQVNNQQHTAA
ncbi:hypothetical protein BN1708_007507 [Verticillium longisporum]|uniref:Uncharacterized protein n=1 Tax=Verticillium longisporum TaxID=100787 RepID=A0A0G4MUD6_VERLO|nr:hypothetical protein BN1708_007507 [Verticillium longisporum]